MDRIKKELGQQLSFKLDSSATKLLRSNDLSRKSSNTTKTFRGIASTSTPYKSFKETGLTSPSEQVKSVREMSKRFPGTEPSGNRNVLTRSTSVGTDTSEGLEPIKTDPDSKELIIPPDKHSNYVVLNNKVHLERMKRFVKMRKTDLPPVTTRKFKCEAPLSELKPPVDTIRCSKCGVLYGSDILVAHLKTCQGERRKTKYGCRLCSFTDCDFRQLEAHIRTVHPKRVKKQA